MVTASISDMTGKLRLVWYHMPYLKNTLKPGSRYIFRGKVSRKKNGLVMEQPQICLLYTSEVKDALKEILNQGSAVPVYTRRRGKEVHVLAETAETDEERAKELLRPVSRSIKKALGDMYLSLIHIFIFNLPNQIVFQSACDPDPYKVRVHEGKRSGSDDRGKGGRRKRLCGPHLYGQPRRGRADLCEHRAFPDVRGLCTGPGHRRSRCV